MNNFSFVFAKLLRCSLECP